MYPVPVFFAVTVMNATGSGMTVDATIHLDRAVPYVTLAIHRAIFSGALTP
jgi:hypothetical protein